MVSSRAVGFLLAVPLSITVLAGCDMVVLRPSGYIAAQQGWLDERRAMLETLTAIRRAGADLILTYFAKAAAQVVSR